jgi:hypothetical protein
MQERRRLARRAVSFGMQIQQGELLIDGIAQDYSPLGLKFRAGVSYAEGFCSGDEALESLEGPEVLVRIFDDRGNEVTTFAGLVCWSAGECCGIQNLSIACEEAA